MTYNKYIIENLPIGYALKKIIYRGNKPHDFEILEANKEFGKILGLDEEHLINKKISEAFPSDLEPYKEWLLKIGDLSKNTRLDYLEDSIVIFNRHYKVRYYSPKKDHIIVYLQPIEKTKENSHQPEGLYKFITEHVLDVIWIYNIEIDKFTYISSAITSLSGFSREEFMEKKLYEVIDQEDAQMLKNLLETRVEKFKREPDKSGHILEEFRQLRKDGSSVWIEISAQFNYNPKGEIEVIGISRDISQRKKIDEQIKYLSYYDQLTDLPNRRYYEESLRKLDLDSNNLPISLLVTDVNGLKLANDAFGHKTGDKLLKAFARVLKNQIRSKDFVARVAGDEFVILLPNTDLETAQKIAKRIKNITRTITVDNIILSASVGCATKVDMNEDLGSIFSKAEDKMYTNKLTESNETKANTIKFIKESLFGKSKKEEQHSKNVSKLCGEIGIAMGLSINKISDLLLLGLYHDIGKIGVDEKILNKDSLLDKLEWYEMKKHPEVGYQILRTVNEYAPIAEFVLYHHERIDGKGYPQGIRGDNIPIESRILSIANAFDSMTMEKPYKKARTKKEAIEELRKNAGKQFDREIVEVFINKVLKKNN